MAGNDHGLLPWRTSNLVNVRRPSGLTYLDKPRGRAEAMAANRVLAAGIYLDLLIASKIVALSL
jgi:hypothetical protein